MSNNAKIISGLIIGLTIIIAAQLLSNAWIRSHNPDNTISVTGLAQKNFTSDLIVWEFSVSRFSPDLISANKNLEKDIEQIKVFLKSKGVTENEIKLSPLNVQRKYKDIYNKEGNVTGEEFEGFNVSQTVVIESKKIDQVEGVISKISELLNMGIEVVSHSPDYYYTQLSSLKMELLEQATKDAYNRAKIIAEHSKGDVGNLKKARMGVFQITGENENEEYEWGGTFNTKSRNKTASITVKLEYEL